MDEAHNAQQALQSVPQQVASFNLDEWMYSFFHSSSTTVQILIFFSGFYLFGALCRRYIRFLFWTFLVLCVVIKWLEFQAVITFNFDALYTLFGIGQEFSFNQLLGTIFGWIEKNVLHFVAGLIGFLMGYKPSSHHNKGVAIKIAK